MLQPKDAIKSEKVHYLMHSQIVHKQTRHSQSSLKRQNLFHEHSPTPEEED